MKKFFSMMIATVALGLAGTASATCPDNTTCFDSFQGVQLGGEAVFGGFGAGIFTGESGAVDVNKSGYAFTETTMNATGDLCGVDCQTGSFTFNGSAGEMVNTAVNAAGTTSDEAVSAINEGAAFSGVGFTFGKFNIPSAQ